MLSQEEMLSREGGLAPDGSAGSTVKISLSTAGASPPSRLSILFLTEHFSYLDESV